MKFDNYDISKQLYDGPGSHVHRARRLSDDTPVILKVLRPALPSPERLAAFRHEFETLRSLAVSGVIGAYGLETDKRNWVLVQEDIGGVSLNLVFARELPRVLKRVDLAIRIVEALGQIHERRVIHKDINPSNIVWNPETDQLKIIDFGIATTLTREHPTVRHPNRLIGTLAYIAPEQTGRMNREIDYRTDFYTLGVTLYQLFTGVLPFVTTDPMELVHCHIARMPKPPHEQAPEVPEMISGIIGKLIAKMAEDRYQSSFGIKADLEACRRQLTSGAAVKVANSLGSADVSEIFQLPQKLYGRDEEVATLLAAFDRVAGASAATNTEDAPEPTGRAELVLVRGYSGIGKSRLVNELQVAITGQRGHFTSGKFDQLQRGTPYIAIANAFRGLSHQLLSERAERLAEWQDSLLAALDGNGRLITDLVPEIELIIGPQPALPELDPAQTQNRLNQVFRRFVRVFAQPSHPLVLFLDDLQWAGSESLKLIELMMTDNDIGHLLVIGAYRDNEVDQAHPLMISVAALKDAKVRIHEVEVLPLPQREVNELVADTLHVSTAAAAQLAQLVHQKTEGNPFFVTQLLLEVHDKGLITCDRAKGRWLWEMRRIKAQAVTTNVVELMVGKLRRQSEATQEALRAASCLGNRFALETLAVIRDQPLSEAYAELLPAVREGLVLPATEPEMALPGEPGAPLAAHEYRFLHDRVQQSAYSLMDEAMRKTLHLRAGRLLLRNASEEERREAVFDIVDQLNHGRDLTDDPAERAEIARLNRWAGQRAKSAAAYPAMREYLANAAELLPDGGWESDYEFMCSVHRDLSEAESLVGNPEPADKLAQELLSRVRTPVERAGVYMMIISQRTMIADYKEALGACRQGLAELGIDMPEEGIADAVAGESVAIKKKLGDRSIPSLYDLPTVQDPKARLAMRLLVNAIPAAFYVDLAAHGWIVSKMVNLTLEFGLSPDSSDLFAFYGHRLVFAHSEFEAGLQSAELAVRLSDRFSSPGDKCRSCFILANWVMVWSRPIGETRAINDEGYKAGLAAGDALFNGYILFYKVFYPFYEGSPLARVLVDVPAFLQFNERSKNQLGIDFFRGFQRAIGMLTGDEPEGDEEEFVRTIHDNQSFMALCYYHIVKAQAHLILGDLEPCLAEVDRAEVLIPSIAGNLASAEHNFYASLCLSALMRDAGEEQRAKLAERLDAYEAVMGKWAGSSPSNFVHMQLLVAAERARAEGREHVAADLYEQAIEDATENGFTQDAALANELAGRSWIARGRHRIGTGFMADALYGYQEWGANGKVSQLTAEFPELNDLEPGRRTPLTTTANRQAKGELDLSSVLKASRAISSEIVLDTLLSTLIETVIENAGAERGVLLLDKEGELWVCADASVQRDKAKGGVVMHAIEPCPLASYEEIPENIINYVRRTLEPVILHDASETGPLTSSPYVIRKRSKSILAMPVSGQGKLLGVFYLENNLTTGAFTPSQIETLELLASQAGISLENALLFREMEQRVADRTLELRAKNADLEQVLLDLKTTQAQLIHAEKMASLGRLSTGIAHEIKNPLNFIINFAKISVEVLDELLEAAGSDPEAKLADSKLDLSELRENNERVLNHGRSADDIICGLTEHSVYPSNERRAVDLNALLEQYVKLTHQDINSVPRAGVAIAVQRAYDSHVGQVEIYPQQMARVFVNLLNNAFDAVLDKQGTAVSDFVPRVAISTRRRGDSVEVRVADNGAGIPPKIRGQIFEPFFTTKPPGTGTGLGLAICHDVVNAHAGQMTVDDSHTEGAAFVVTLPVRP